jgi:MoxR-like ATPase
MSLESGARQELDELGALLREHGLVKPDGVRDTKAAKARMLASCAEARIEPRQTKSGDVCLDSDACNSVVDPLLEAYAQFSSYKKVLSNDVEALKGGVLHPIHTHFDLAETGRTTSSKPNVQNPRRLPGVRECFVPRGFVE